MTLSMCDRVAERVALGEPLGELTEHVSACASCRGLVAVSGQLAAAHHAVDPGLGFSARMTAGAQHRLSVRRRRRLAAGLAATLAAGALGVFAVVHPSKAPGAETVGARPPPHEREVLGPHRDDVQDATPDADLAALVQLADVDRARRLSARWRHIKKPLAPYKKLLEGVVP